MVFSSAGLLILTVGVPSMHAAPVRLARHPDYHAGKIAFSYLGDIWTANEDGTNVHRLTDNLAREVYPRFSPDGKWIAFSSNRYGNNDVFVVSGRRRRAEAADLSTPATTRSSAGRATRSSVIFRAARGDGAFPSVATLYQIAVDRRAGEAAAGRLGLLGQLLAGRQVAGLQPPSGGLVAPALSRQLRRRPVGRRPRRQDLHEAPRRRALQPLLADVGRRRRDLLRRRSAAERQEREAGQPRGAQERQQHLQDSGRRAASRCR